MIKNRKGFMLVEVVITSAVIITTLVGLYSSFSNLFSKYNVRSNYHNIDALYATKEMSDYLFENDFNLFVNQYLYEYESVYIIQNGVCKLGDDYTSFCNVLLNLYQVYNMIFTSYDAENLIKLREGEALTNLGEVSLKNQTMKEYIDYIIGYYDIKNSNVVLADGEPANPYSYFLLTETMDGEDCYYAGVPIR